MINDLWYKNSIIYSLDIETFLDANGDGTGDFEGLCNRLDYIQALGVDTIWLAPFQPTPNKDNGYDVRDYYGVDARHGSSGDFVEFMYQAKRRGLKVLIDLVVNHTSDQHFWFQEARKSPDSKYRDWYIWSEKKPSDWDEGMVFPGVQNATWTYDSKAKAWYHHRFYAHQPDLNTRNPEVRKEILKIIGYWIELGVSGFRVDALPFLIEHKEPGKKSAKLHYEYLAEMRRFLQWRKGDAILLGEANVLPKDTKKYFGEAGEGIQMMFNFYVNQHIFYTLATADTKPLKRALEQTRVSFFGSQWAQFLRNHDELDLGRLTEKQRETVFARFAPEPYMQLYHRGIRRRLGPMLGNRQQSELAYSLIFSLPGTPVIRYGDEIGLGDNLDLNERDAVRTPMHWSEDPNAGFSTNNKLIHPVINEGPYSFLHVNVEDQRRDPKSLLNWMTALIRLRKECPEIGWGDWTIIETGIRQVLVIQYNHSEKSLVIVHNFDSKPHELVLKLRQVPGEKLVDLMKNDQVSEAGPGGSHKITIDAYGYRWFRSTSPLPPQQ